MISTVDHRPAHRREHAAGDDVWISPDFPCVFQGQPGRNQRRGAADHHAPAGGGIGAAQLFKALEERGDIHLRAAQRCGHQHAEQAGLCQFGGQIGGQPALRLGIGGAGSDRFQQRLRDHHSFHSEARLFFCMSLDPPTIGMPSRSRTCRSMSNASDSA
jgi:hypothetical protein